MSKDKNTLLNTLAEPISNSVKNLIDKPTQNIGTTIADIWYLVFGGISQAAKKRELKYFYALQEFKNELKENISKIPNKNLCEPDIQIVAPALEAARYCIEKKELREMFVKLISSSMNIEQTDYVHPIFSSIINHLSVSDALLFKKLGQVQHKVFSSYKTNKEFLTSLFVLESQGLIYTNIEKTNIEIHFKNADLFLHIVLTELGKSFYKICISNK